MLLQMIAMTIQEKLIKSILLNTYIPTNSLRMEIDQDNLADFSARTTTAHTK